MRGQTSKPLNFINISISLSSLNFAARSLRFSLVSNPWIVFASAQRFRPCSVIGPVDLALINTAYSLLTHRQGIGPGDWKLAAVIGAWLGLENLIIDLIVAFVLAA